MTSSNFLNFTPREIKQMITTLSIKNYAIIEEVEIDFSTGLTIITGETGAGKSILLGALGLVMGERADLGVLFNKNQKCIVEAKFDVCKYDLKAYFAEQDLDYFDELVVRREITTSGKSRAFVNDTPVRLDILRAINSTLIDLHQQFDTFDIHAVSYQLRMLDALAGNGELLKTYRNQYNQYLQNKRKLSALIEGEGKLMQELDFLNFQLEEFDQAQLQDGELAALETEQNELNNFEKIKSTVAEAALLLNDGENPVLELLQRLSNRMEDLASLNDKFGAISKIISSSTLELQEASNELQSLTDDLEFDADRQQFVEERLSLIYQLQKKHGCKEYEELLLKHQHLLEKREKFEHQNDEVEKLDRLVGEQENRLFEWALKLHENRVKILPEFELKVHENLSLLSMDAAKFKVEITVNEELNNSGTDEVNFLFSANKGGALQAIKDVASGGELARLTLVTKSLVAASIPLPTLIFDEIDIGVSGSVAIKMGDILRRLAAEHQVVVITHSPQVASRGERHYKIYKEEDETRSYTKMKPMDRNERIQELAIMLSQDPPSEAAILNAKELVEID